MSSPTLPSPALPYIQSPRLLLRPFTPEDAAQVELYAGDRAVADTTANIPHPYPKGSAAAWIAGHAPAWEARTHLTLAIVRQDAPHDLVGTMGCRLDMPNAGAELGYWIRVPDWGRGYATEAATALTTFAFTVCGVHRMQARHLTRNPSSGRVMQKLGMTCEGVLRQSVRKWDVFEDLAVYAVLASEWSIIQQTQRGATS